VAVSGHAGVAPEAEQSAHGVGHTKGSGVGDTARLSVLGLRFVVGCVRRTSRQRRHNYFRRHEVLAPHMESLPNRLGILRGRYLVRPVRAPSDGPGGPET
jgi:hypothetical protein